MRRKKIHIKRHFAHIRQSVYSDIPSAKSIWPRIVRINRKFTNNFVSGKRIDCTSKKTGYCDGNYHCLYKYFDRFVKGDRCLETIRDKNFGN